MRGKVLNYEEDERGLSKGREANEALFAGEGFALGGNGAGSLEKLRETQRGKAEGICWGIEAT